MGHKDMYMCIVHCVNAGNNHQEVFLLLRARKRDNGATRGLAGDEDVAAKVAAIEKQQQPLSGCTSRLIMMMAAVMRIYCFAFTFHEDILLCSVGRAYDLLPSVRDSSVHVQYVCIYGSCMPKSKSTEVSDTRISMAIPPEY